MDCDTTGIEPDIALVKFKKLSGGGILKIVNRTVPEALASLGYSPEAIRDMVAYVDENGTIEGAPGLLEEHLPVFDCAFKPVNGVRTIHYMGHVRMMAAVQPFLSGAISKTVNMPSDATPDEISALYLEGWRQGLKAIAIYRDGCKKAQPLNTSLKDKSHKGAEKGDVLRKPARRRLPDERMSITHKFSISGHEGYLTVGMYEDGTPGEIFVTMAKEGSVVSGLMDTIATMTSIALQYGVPFETLVKKFSHMRFEPSGFTNNPQIPMAKSVIDYIFRWLSIKFVPTVEGGAADAPSTIAPPPSAAAIASPAGTPGLPAESAPSDEVVRAAHSKRIETDAKGDGIDILALRKNRAFITEADAPTCTECGAIMVRNGKCYRCHDCGNSSGCS
jgi:ribonucleoside-diphosphate reductase alpha chain